jgi:hypothetical protein
MRVGVTVSASNRRPAYVFTGGAVAIVLVALLVHWLAQVEQVEAILYVIAGFLVVAAAGAPFVSKAFEDARQRHERQSGEELETIKQATDDITENPGLQKLVVFNYRLMERFVDVALGQAKAAYLFCAAACSAGLLILLTGTVALVTVHTATAQITVGGLTAIGTALSGYISRTFIKTFKLTSRQMSYYYGQPVVHCYLLHAEWLAGRAAHHHSETARAFDADLIDATIKAGHDAQCHLLDLLEDKPAGHEHHKAPAGAGALLNGVSSAPVAR